MIFKVSIITMHVQSTIVKIKEKIPEPEKNSKDKSPVINIVIFISQINHKNIIINFCFPPKICILFFNSSGPKHFSNSSISFLNCSNKSLIFISIIKCCVFFLTRLFKLFFSSKLLLFKSEILFSSFEILFKFEISFFSSKLLLFKSEILLSSKLLFKLKSMLLLSSLILLLRIPSFFGISIFSFNTISFSSIKLVLFF